MAAITKASAKAYFLTGSKPTQAQFEDLIDSYQDASDHLSGLVAAVSADVSGLVYYTDASTASMVSLGSAGRALVSADTKASAVSFLAISVGTATSDTAGIIEIATTAEVATGTDTERAVTPAGAAAHYSPIDRSVNAQTGTTYTFVLADAGKLCTFSNASAVTVTVPPNSSVAFDVGTQIDVLALGAGAVSIAAGSGVTVSSKDSNLQLSEQYSGGTLLKIATDTWVLVGDLT